MILPRQLPSDACYDDPIDRLDPTENDQTLVRASEGITRVYEWITRGRGGASQRALRSDLVILCVCPHLLPCKRLSASWCAREHRISRQRASILQQEFARGLGDHIQFRGQRFRS